MTISAAFQEVLEHIIAYLPLYHAQRLRLVSSSLARLVRRSSLHRSYLDLVPLSPLPTQLTSVFSHYPRVSELYLHWKTEQSVFQDMSTVLTSLAHLLLLKVLIFPLSGITIASSFSALHRLHHCLGPDRKPLEIDTLVLFNSARLFKNIELRSLAANFNKHFIEAVKTGRFSRLRYLVLKQVDVTSTDFLSVLHLLPNLKFICFDASNKTVIPILYAIVEHCLPISFHAFVAENGDMDHQLLNDEFLCHYDSLGSVDLGLALRKCPYLKSFRGPCSTIPMISCPPLLTDLHVHSIDDYKHVAPSVINLIGSVCHSLSSVGMDLRNSKIADKFYSVLTSSIKELDLIVKVSDHLNTIPRQCPNLEKLTLSGGLMRLDALEWSELAPIIRTLLCLKELELHRVYFDEYSYIYCNMLQMRNLTLKRVTMKHDKLCASLRNLIQRCPLLTSFYCDDFIDGLCPWLVCWNKRLVRVWFNRVATEATLKVLDDLPSLMVRPSGYTQKQALLSRDH
ncbi:hypothetical protein RCL1_008728 [Eukaryota sp. TZLM3-RCL]